MAYCVSCGCPLFNEEWTSTPHACLPAGWSDGNRAFCDFIHRGILRPRDRASEPALYTNVYPDVPPTGET